MYVCARASACASVCMYVHPCVCVCVGADLYVYTCTCLCGYVYVHARMCICVCMCARTQLSIHERVRIYVCMHMYVVLLCIFLIQRQFSSEVDMNQLSTLPHLSSHTFFLLLSFPPTSTPSLFFTFSSTLSFSPPLSSYFFLSLF